MEEARSLTHWVVIYFTKWLPTCWVTCWVRCSISSGDLVDFGGAAAAGGFCASGLDGLVLMLYTYNSKTKYDTLLIRLIHAPDTTHIGLLPSKTLLQILNCFGLNLLEKRTGLQEKNTKTQQWISCAQDSIGRGRNIADCPNLVSLSQITVDLLISENIAKARSLQLLLDDLTNMRHVWLQ